MRYVMSNTSEPVPIGDVWRRLAAPFPPDEVGIKVQSVNKDRKSGLVVAFIDARNVMDRLDEVLGPGHWRDHYDVLTIEPPQVRCRLGVRVDGEWITKEDVGTTGQNKDFKDAVSDGLKRAAVKFGIGRYLYRLPKTFTDLDERQRIKHPEQVRRKILGPTAGSAAGGYQPEPARGQRQERGRQLKPASDPAPEPPPVNGQGRQPATTGGPAGGPTDLVALRTDLDGHGVDGLLAAKFAEAVTEWSVADLSELPAEQREKVAKSLAYIAPLMDAAAGETVGLFLSYATQAGEALGTTREVRLALSNWRAWYTEPTP